MELRNIIVIGASAGGFDAIKTLVAGLPKTLNASVMIVWHISPDVQGILPHVLNKGKGLFATNAVDKEPIKPNRIYVAPPDHHLLIENDVLRVSRGPKENRFRPAIDPLFRSAAYAYGPRVIGVILSGALDDGAAGLWAIKQCGGIAIVQDPEDAEVSAMPENALRAVKADHRVPVSQMADLLVKLSEEEVAVYRPDNLNDNSYIKAEIGIALKDNTLENNMMKYGELTPYTCPECHGVLTSIKEGDRLRFRCHTGHAFSSDSLLMSVTQNIEESLWSAIRGVEESIMLLNNLGDHFAEENKPRLAALYFKKAAEAEVRFQALRDTVFNHEQLSRDGIQQQADQNNL